MKMRVVALGIAVLAGGIVATQLWWELRAQRVRGAELVARVAALEALPPAPVLAPPAPEPVGVPAQIASPVTTAQARPVTTAEAVTRPAPAGEVAAKAPAAAMVDALQSAQGQDFTRSMMRTVLAQMYPDIETEVGLTPEEAMNLLDLLGRQQQDVSMESMSLMGGGARDPAVMREAQRKLVEKQRAHEQELSAMLGSKYPKWEEYQGTAAARQQVEQLRTTLSASGNPLSETQSKSLVTAFAAEQTRMQKQEREWMASAAAIESPNMLGESMQRALEGQRKLIDVATPHLSAEQANQFRRQVEQQASMLNATMGLMGIQAGTP